MRQYLGFSDEADVRQGWLLVINGPLSVSKVIERRLVSEKYKTLWILNAVDFWIFITVFR
jgi:hypothetical protein